MKKAERLWQRLSLAAALPDEPIPGLPLVEIIHNCRVLIENHLGVNAYGREMIRVRVKFGSVCIAGADLELARMVRGQLIISGTIDSVTLCRG